MQQLPKQFRWVIGLSLAAVSLAFMALFVSASNVTAQSSQNKTMHDLIVTLNNRFQGEPDFQFNVNVPYSFYNHDEVFTINDTDTKVVEIGDDHLCMEDSTDAANVQTFCYPYSTISIVYPIPK